MKTTLNLLFATIICVVLSSAAWAQNEMMIRPRIQPAVNPMTQTSDALGLDIESHRGHGLKVAAVRIGGPAHEAGIEVGDVIIGADGKHVRTLPDLEYRASRVSGDLLLHVKDIRSGRVLTTWLRPRVKVGNPLAQMPTLGVEVEALYNGGYKIVSLGSGSIAEFLGLARGDVLRTVNGQSIANVDGDVYKFEFTLVYDDAGTGVRTRLHSPGF